jgi:hypothetical protein
MKPEELRQLLNDRKQSLLKKLKYAASNHLEYWKERPGNLPGKLLVTYLRGIDHNKMISLTISPRESLKGKYGQTGFEWIFKYEEDFILWDRPTRIFVKGFFFEKDDPRGVEIQSFRRANR